jgi:hypothetical protein
MKDIIDTMAFIAERVEMELDVLDHRLNEPEFILTESEAKLWIASLAEIDQTLSQIQDKIRPVLEILENFPPQGPLQDHEITKEHSGVDPSRV